VNNLAGFSQVFNELHLSVDEAGNMLGEMEANAVPAARGMTGLESAMKAAKEQGQDFQTFIRRAADSLEYYGRTGQEQAAEAISVDIFGTRKWAESEVAARSYLDTVRQGPQAFAGNGEQLTDLEQKTRNLHNRWQEVENRVKAALAPAALNVVDDISHKMDSFVNWLTAHQDDLREFFAGSVDVIQQVLGALGEVASVLGHHPALIEAVAVAFGTWEAIKGVDAVLTGIESLMSWLGMVPGEATAAAAGVSAADTEMATATTAAGAEMELAFGPVMETLTAGIPAAAETSAAGITTAMTEADAAVVGLGSTLDAVLVTLGAIAGAAGVAATALALVNLHGDSGPGPQLGGDRDPVGPHSPAANDYAQKQAAGQAYQKAHGGRMPDHYQHWLTGRAPMPPDLAPYYHPGGGAPAPGAPAPPPGPQPPPGPAAPAAPRAGPTLPGTSVDPGAPPDPNAPPPPDLLTPDDLDPKKHPKGPRCRIPLVTVRRRNPARPPKCTALSSGCSSNATPSPRRKPG
jgi:hypothetical protein